MTVSLVDSNEIEWLNGLDVLPTMPQAFRDNLGPSDQLESMLAKYDVRPLLFDPETTRRIDLVTLHPGYSDLTSAYHESVEECYVLSGSCQVEEFIGRGDYFWRPPGWVHSATSAEGFVALLMMEGVSEGDASGPGTRVIRPVAEEQTNQLHDHAERANGPRGWVRKASSELMAWQAGPTFARGEGSVHVVDLDAMAVKVLSKNVDTGAQSLRVSLAPGFRLVPSTQRAHQYSYVIEGSLHIGDQVAGPGVFFEQSAGQPCPVISAPDGAELFMKLDGPYQVDPM